MRHDGVRKRPSGSNTQLQDVMIPVDTLLSTVYSECTQSQPKVTAKPTTFAGKPCIAETRIPIALVLRYLILKADPIEDLGITQEDIDPCLPFAALVCDYPLIEYEQ